MNDDTRRFIAALEQGDMAKLRRVPKSDLHTHCCNGGNRRYIAQLTGVVVPHLTKKLSSMAEMDEWVTKNVGPLIDNAEKRKTAIHAAFVQARDDGVAILEIGEDVWTKDAYYGGSVDRIVEMFQKVHAETAPHMVFRPQIGLSRHCPIERLYEWAEPFLEHRYFKCLDLYCDEAAQPIQNFKKIYRRAKDKGIKLKAHVGEWGSAESIREAVEELELDEVQHGISAATDRATMKWLAENRITLNICPTSNVMLGRVESMATHSIRTLYDNGVRVTINTDDMLVFDQSVSEEFMELFAEGLFTAQELDEIRRNGLQ